MAKAYKCDLCNIYCDDVFKITGIYEPITHVVGRFGKNCVNGLDCCEKCYDKICGFVCNLMDDNIDRN